MIRLRAVKYPDGRVQGHTGRALRYATTQVYQEMRQCGGVGDNILAMWYYSRRVESIHYYPRVGDYFVDMAGNYVDLTGRPVAPPEYIVDLTGPDEVEQQMEDGVAEVEQQMEAEIVDLTEDDAVEERSVIDLTGDEDGNLMEVENPGDEDEGGDDDGNDGEHEGDEDEDDEGDDDDEDEGEDGDGSMDTIEYYPWGWDRGRQGRQ